MCRRAGLAGVARKRLRWRGFYTAHNPLLNPTAAARPNPFAHAQFVMSCASLDQCPADGLSELAFAGRSNSGKSSALNALCNQKSLARVSKTPGRTQLINLFELPHQTGRMVDLITAISLKRGRGHQAVAEVRDSKAPVSACSGPAW